VLDGDLERACAADGVGEHDAGNVAHAERVAEGRLDSVAAAVGERVAVDCICRRPGRHGQPGLTSKTKLRSTVTPSKLRPDEAGAMQRPRGTVRSCIRNLPNASHTSFTKSTSRFSPCATSCCIGEEEGGRRIYFIFSHLRTLAINDDDAGKAGNGDGETKSQQGGRHAMKRSSHTGKN
jgi:hypothetical protein